MATKTSKINPIRGEFEFELNGVKMKGHASINALRMFCLDKGKRFDELHEIMEDDELGVMAELIYFSCLNYAHRHDVDLSMTKAKFISYALDNLDETSKAASIVMESMKVAKESQGEEPKK